ncbi:MAG: 50S ribosomal protein L15 [Planctomycetota bacterium]|jgi:large subunit ribosomal protein L15
MNLSDAVSNAGPRRKRKRVGRGHAAGQGKTCGRGQMGQGARSGAGIHLWSEGGQMQLWRRTTKRGFSNARHRDVLAVINVKQLGKFSDGDTVDSSSLRKHKLINGKCDGWALLGVGECTVKNLKIYADRISATAREKVTAQGGEVVSPKPAEPKKQKGAKAPKAEAPAE